VFNKISSVEEGFLFPYYVENGMGSEFQLVPTKFNQRI
jgi:hypothetical protein